MFGDGRPHSAGGGKSAPSRGSNKHAKENRRPQTANSNPFAGGGKAADGAQAGFGGRSDSRVLGGRERMTDVETLEELFYNSRKEYMRLEMQYQSCHGEVSIVLKAIRRSSPNNVQTTDSRA